MFDIVANEMWMKSVIDFILADWALALHVLIMIIRVVLLVVACSTAFVVLYVLSELVSVRRHSDSTYRNVFADKMESPPETPYSDPKWN